MNNSNNEFQGYEIWNTRIPEISPRSLLYNLQPVGIGTADVESFSGYISRLAQEHYLSPVVLLKNSVRDLSELPKSLLQNSFSAVFAKSLNGFGDNTSKMVDILQKATFRDDIRYTTLLSWKDIVSNQRLLKNHLAWCPSCHEEHKNGRRIIYEKLIWSIEKVKACHIHELPLAETCPHCHKKIKVLSGKSRPGYCSKCLGWLGSNLVNFDDLSRFRNEEEKKLEIWKAIKIGEALTSFSYFADSGQNEFIENLTGLVQSISGGIINDFAHRTGMWHISIRRLLKGEVSPTVGMILKICFPLEIPIIELFVPKDEIKETSAVFYLDKPKTKDEMKVRLSELLSEHPPPSANEVSRRTGWRIARWQRNLPAEYKEIVERYASHAREKLPQLKDEEIEKILSEAAKENPPPSLQSVFRRIGCRSTGFRYYRRFPELCREIAERYKRESNKSFDLKKAERVMKLALTESPPPSFSEVARRLKCNRETLNKKLPELSKSLHKRYEDYLEESKKNNRIELYNAVKNAIEILQKERVPISENKVKKHLPRKWNDRNFKEIYRLIKQELGIVTEK
ncbi:MAG: TniQ family protein [Pyrinomonadaceae bacterium]